jgi:NADPH-dependent 2,4-dienoyl-CoA reductase/sulfur reductase-like enzyme
MPSIVIIGAGPAGVRAAETLVRAGVRPTVIDEALASGGQIYRRPPSSIVRDSKKVYGFEAARARSVHRAFDDLREQIDYWPDSAVWSAHDHKLGVITKSGPKELAWDRLILATGAMDRVIPFRGWTLPGVYTLGGAQVALKYQACAIGEHPVFLGTGPLLYLVAYQYAAAGVKVAGVLDTASAGAKRGALFGLVSGGRTFLKGLYYLAWLRAHGLPVVSGARPVCAHAGLDGAVRELEWRDGHGSLHRTACDSIATGFGLKSEAQIADLCDVPFIFDTGQRQWVPVQDTDGRAAVEGLYLAGDGVGIKGAAAAELSGERAAHTLLHDLGHARSAERLKTLNRRLRRFERFRRALDEKAFKFPADLAASADDDLMICRCEGVTAGELRHAARELGATEINRAKAFTRVGMGRCQGRVCGPAAAEILANSLGVPLAAVGRLRGQVPIKPVPMAAFLDGAVP